MRLWNKKSTSDMNYPPRILFVCMGNICRSPAGDGVLKHLLNQSGVKAEVDSAGTIGLHAGELPDKRMRAAAAKRAIKLDHRARQVKAADLEEFDLILVMDKANLSDVLRLDSAKAARAKIKLFREYCTRLPGSEVPDPYCGDESDFEHVLDLMEDGCEEIVRRLSDGTLI
jgi:protein-tyrosine phosphatase